MQRAKGSQRKFEYSNMRVALELKNWQCREDSLVKFPQAKLVHSFFSVWNASLCPMWLGKLQFPLKWHLLLIEFSLSASWRWLFSFFCAFAPHSMNAPVTAMVIAAKNNSKLQWEIQIKTFRRKSTQKLSNLNFLISRKIRIDKTKGELRGGLGRGWKLISRFPSTLPPSEKERQKGEKLINFKSSTGKAAFKVLRSPETTWKSRAKVEEEKKLIA